jgi:hypothetical protein
MEYQIIILVCSITACIFSIIALCLAFLSLAKAIGLEKSTHSVQFMPADEVRQWATPEKDIDEINKEFKEEEVEPLGL